ncbi:MAG: NAD(P)/FAD-dependent oxidoreductase [Myxococcales bacterium]|nr:NAD(P)/FAD-dependent oxidoreductase [Myxococcales bacterium]
MKKLVILGAGTAGTMMANKLRHHLGDDWSITLVDRDEDHVYQPGLLFLPFGIYNETDLVRRRRDFIPEGVDFRVAEIDVVRPDKKQVVLQRDAGVLDYDILVVATGTRIVPAETEGMTGAGWHESVFDFYTLDGSAKLRSALERWKGGRLILNIVDMPIKCPVAPLEFLFLADHYFHEAGIRDAVELVFATPLDAAFTKPRAAETLGYLLEQKQIKLETNFTTKRVDGAAKQLHSYDGRALDYDILVTIPLHAGSEWIKRSGIGDDMGFLPTDKHTLKAEGLEDVFALGDTTNLPTSKAGSVAHFQGDVLFKNITRHIRGLELLPEFDGHANCFIETGFGKGMLIDFNYDTEPLPGKFPLPGIGPFSLLRETAINHWGKLGFKWVYWNMLITGRELPLDHRMLMAGKVA